MIQHDKIWHAELALYHLIPNKLLLVKMFFVSLSLSTKSFAVPSQLRGNDDLLPSLVK